MSAGPSGHGTAASVRRLLARLHITDLHVEVMDECAHLYGVARTYEQKRLAGELTEQATGLPVVNELRIAQCGFDEDERLLQDVARELARLPNGVGERITVDVRDGAICLHGTVRDEIERQAVGRAARSARNAAQVEDCLELESEAVSDAEVARSLSAYVERAARFPGGAVQVGFRGGVASLTGSVATDVQRRAIEDLIRWHHGVRDVENRLSIRPTAAAHAPTGKQL
ncbi:MAG TPA: BON domain-containing protein [Dehalococcoidia bacterium]|nr:BON domain-containing protein [Dehalococcoidia bacterium]